MSPSKYDIKKKNGKEDVGETRNPLTFWHYGSLINYISKNPSLLAIWLTLAKVTKLNTVGVLRLEHHQRSWNLSANESQDDFPLKSVTIGKCMHHLPYLLFG